MYNYHYNKEVHLYFVQKAKSIFLNSGSIPESHTPPVWQREEGLLAVGSCCEKHWHKLEGQLTE